MGSRHERNPAEHPLRAEILRLLDEQPGLSFMELVRAARRSHRVARASQGTLEWHLRVLVRERVLVSVRSGRFRRYYPNRAPWTMDLHALALVQSEPTRTLARLVALEPGMSVVDLVDRVPASVRREVNWLRRQLGRLVRRGLVLVEFRRGANRYHATRRLVRLLATLPASPAALLPMHRPPPGPQQPGGGPRPDLPPPGAASQSRILRALAVVV